MTMTRHKRNWKLLNLPPPLNRSAPASGNAGGFEGGSLGTTTETVSKSSAPKNQFRRPSHRQIEMAAAAFAPFDAKGGAG